MERADPISAGRRVKIGLIGGGMMSQVGHLPFYLADKRCEVAAIAEVRPSLVEFLERDCPRSRILRDHADLLADPEIEAVVIAAPRPAMAPLALAALQAGKHVLMEKPMAHTLAQAARLVDASASAKRVLAVGFMKRYDPGVQAARDAVADLVASARLGKLVLARFYNFAKVYAVPPPPHKRPEESRTERFEAWPLWPDWLPENHRETYGWFMNSASHDINLINFFFPGAIEVLSATSLSSDAIVATLVAQGTLIELEIGKAAPGLWLEGAEFVFEKGRLAVQIPSPMATDQVAQVTIQENVDSPRQVQLETETGWSFERQARGFVDVLLGIAEPLTSGVQGVQDLALCERVWQKIAEHAHGCV